MLSETRLAEAPASEQSIASPSRVGEVLGERYELIAKIGEGGMGEVYEARHKTLGRHFAVKLLHPELARSQRMLRRFSREALAASRLRSDHIVSVFDCGHTSEGVPYFVMDLLHGRNLRSILREEAQLSVPRAARLVIDTCRGLHVAHREGLVHRDLKPENLFVVESDSGQELAKILDFGVVLTNGDTIATQPGTLIGTLKYMAPEQVRGASRVDSRVDVYALGVVLYECLTGELPHPGENAEEVLFHIINEAPKPASTLRPDLAPELTAVIEKAMAREAVDRYQSASAFADALLPFVGESLPPVCTRYPRLPPESSVRTMNATQGERTASEESSSAAAPPVASGKTRLAKGQILAFALGAVIATAAMSALLLQKRGADSPLAMPAQSEKQEVAREQTLASPAVPEQVVLPQKPSASAPEQAPAASAAPQARATSDKPKLPDKRTRPPSPPTGLRSRTQAPAASVAPTASPFDHTNPYVDRSP